MIREKIIVIDDESVIREAVSEILTDKGYNVEIAASGEEGLEIIKKTSFDLIITDINMPGMHGTELIKKVREEVSTEVAIIVITAHGSLDVAIQSMEHGTQGFILKPFTPSEILTSISNVLSKARIIKENIKLKTLVPIFEVNKRLLSELHIGPLLELIVSEAASYTGSERTSLMLLEEDGNLQLKSSNGFNTETESETEVEKNFSAWVLENKAPLLIDSGTDLPGEFRVLMEKKDIKSALSMPLMARGKLLGILNLAKINSDQPFTTSDMEIVSVLSGQVGIAIENAKLYESVENLHLGIITTLANAVEARDQYTADHALRLSTYSMFIARKLGMPRDEIEVIKRAAVLHDIGKIGIPDNILLKGSSLTKEEHEIMKEHPVIGCNILSRMKELKEISTIVKHHHEFYDGTGYPDGLKGEEIPIGARIVSAADAYEAMTSVRPYRNALPFHYAVEELDRMSGKQFDPRIVEAFKAVLKKTGI